MKKEKILSELQKAREAYAEIIPKKDGLVEGIREYAGEHAPNEEYARKLQYELDVTLLKLTETEMKEVKLLKELSNYEPGAIDPKTLAYNWQHLKEREKETKERIDKHKHRMPIPWETYEEALKDTKEKEDHNKRIKELREKEVFSRG